MKLPPDFQRTLAAMNDGELSLMLADFEDYVPEAITLARAELERRKIPVEEVAHLRRIIQAVPAAPRGFFGDNVARALVLHVVLFFVAGVSRGC
jgi:hypothetical protein